MTQTVLSIPPGSGADRPGRWRLARAIGCLFLLALLSACAGGQHISATQEASQYEQRAHRSYTPPGPRSDPWGPYIAEASSRFDVPERWIREVMRVESGGHTELNGMPITSGAGAMGLMQVMPATFDELRGRYQLGSDPYDPYNSIMAGSAYIRELYDLYGSPGFLAAYNGGPGRLDDYLTRNRPLPDETRRYVAMIGPHVIDTFPNKRSMAEQYAMNSVPAAIPSGPRYTAPAAEPAYAPPAASPPVEVAYAPPTDSDGAFDPPPGWTPRAMSPAERAAYVPPSNAVPVPAPVVPPPALSPAYGQPTITARNDLPPPPSSVYSAAPIPRDDAVDEPAPTLASRALPPSPVPPPYVVAPRTPSHTTYAALPAPPAYVPPAVQTASASGYAPFPASSRQKEQGFRLVPPAMAAAAPYYRGSAPGQWAIQVGAFGNEGLAHIAVGSAREQAGPVLAAAHQAVATIREPHGTLYRARLTGLSRDAATQACERLRGHGSCVVLSPDAQ